MKNFWSKILILFLFALAMGYLEAAVVVYLRALILSNEVSISASGTIYWVEIFREAATIVMLVTLTLLVAKNWLERFLYFIYIFSIWDISYYLFLYLILRWPPTLFTQDIYFLIPKPWIGPVWFPLFLFSILFVVSFHSLFKRNIYNQRK